MGTDSPGFGRLGKVCLFFNWMTLPWWWISPEYLKKSLVFESINHFEPYQKTNVAWFWRWMHNSSCAKTSKETSTWKSSKVGLPQALSGSYRFWAPVVTIEVGAMPATWMIIPGIVSRITGSPPFISQLDPFRPFGGGPTTPVLGTYDHHDYDRPGMILQVSPVWSRYAGH